VLSLVADLDTRRPTPRLWFPSGFGKLGRKLASRAPVTVDQQPLAMGTASDPTKFESSAGTEGGDAEEEEAEDGGTGEEEQEEKVVRRAYPLSCLPSLMI
jgi:hypothetical protein